MGDARLKIVPVLETDVFRHMPFVNMTKVLAVQRLASTVEDRQNSGIIPIYAFQHFIIIEAEFLVGHVCLVGRAITYGRTTLTNP